MKNLIGVLPTIPQMGSKVTGEQLTKVLHEHLGDNYELVGLLNHDDNIDEGFLMINMIHKKIVDYLNDSEPGAVLAFHMLDIGQRGEELPSLINAMFQMGKYPRKEPTDPISFSYQLDVDTNMSGHHGPGYLYISFFWDDSFVYNNRF